MIGESERLSASSIKGKTGFRAAAARTGVIFSLVTPSHDQIPSSSVLPLRLKINRF